MGHKKDDNEQHRNKKVDDDAIRLPYGYSFKVPRLLRFLVVGGFGAFVNLAFVWIGSNLLSLGNTGASTLGMSYFIV